MENRWSLLLIVVASIYGNAAQTTECTQATVADIVFLIDGSSSIGIENFQEVRQFLKNFIKGLNIGEDKVRVGLAQYSDEPHQEFLLKDHMDKMSLLEQVDNLSYRSGGTATGKAIGFLQTKFFTKDAGSRTDQRVPQIAVVITDGDSTDDVVKPAHLLRSQGVIVFAIGVGAADMAELQAIANRPHERFLFSIDSYLALQRLTEGLLQTVCVSMEDQRKALDQRFSDIFFLIDSSMSQTEFQQTRSLYLRLANQIDIGASAHRVGLAQFGENVRVEFLLNKHKTKEDTVANMRRFRLRNMKPNEPRNLGYALEYARTNFFTSEAGSREDQGFRQFLIVVTGGNSDDDIFKESRRIKADAVTVVGVGLGSATLKEMKILATSPYIYQTTNILTSLKVAFETEEEVTAPSEDCKMVNVADIVFVIDESGSIRTPNFQLVRSFIHKIVEGLDVDPKRVRIGIIMYSDTPTAQVYLNSFNDKNEILQFIKILPYRGGGTNTGSALKFVREKVFVKEKGSRKGLGVQQVAVVITDGQSQDVVSEEAANLRRSGVTVYAVGIKNANKTQLFQMASHPPKKHVFVVDSFVKLKTLEQSLQKSLCLNIFQQAIPIDTWRDTIKEGCKQTEEADIFFLIDHSGSIHPNEFYDMKKFIIEFFHNFEIGPQHIRVGVAKYADFPTLEIDPTTYVDASSLEKAVENINQIGGGTKTGAALSFMSLNFERARATRGHSVKEYLVILTDGKSSDDVKAPAEMLRTQGVTIYAIGVKNADEAELLEIAGSPKNKFFVNDFDALQHIKDEVITDICSQNACQDIPGDLLFLIDSSSSIRIEDYQTMKELMKVVINKSDIGQNQGHVGVMQFSDIQRLEFSLNQFYDKNEISKAIDGMQQIKGATQTGKAISDISQYFDVLNGGRPDHRKTLIVITDGESQDEVKGPAETLRAKGVIIYAIGVENANTTQLRDISGRQDRFILVKNFEDLKDLESQLVLKICNPDPDCKKTEKADIIFLVDGSTSITLPKFRSMLKFMESMVNRTIVGEKLTRFGVILYSNDPSSMFTLKDHYSKRGVLKAIKELKSPYGDTYTGKALAYSLQFFDTAHGGRRALEIPQILMVITDGDATDRYDLVKPSQALRKKGISVFSIGVEGANKTQLEIMAGGDASKVFYVDNFDALETLHNNITHSICNITIKDCEKQKADLVMLIDQSTTIDSADYDIMKEFMVKLVTSFKVSQEMVRVGVAQFSSTPQREFYLDEFSTKEEVNEHIRAMTQRGEVTNIGQALDFIWDYFQESRGSRISAGILQKLVLITAGKSQDEVDGAVRRLKGLGIEVFAICIGNVCDLELQEITGTADRFFKVPNFSSLPDIKKKVLDAICQAKLSDCSVDIAMGFDISQRTGTELASGHLRLQTFLPEIANYVPTLQGPCSLRPNSVKSKIAFRVVSRDGQTLYDYDFEDYNVEVIRKVMALKMSEPTYFNTALLNSFRDKFKVESNAKVKVLVIFSDGLDEDVRNLEQESKLLQESGISALLIVGLENVRAYDLIQRVEFGRGFGYKLPLSIGMQSIGTTMLRQIDTVADKECNNITCKCSGQEGIHGYHGPPGLKGSSGPKGYPGFPGEEGLTGDRGLPGLMGPQGIQGCPGIRGQKGYRGYRGDRGEEGEHGLDGVSGEQGLPGLSGAKGEKGNTGDPGIKGTRGELGLKGQRGLRGDPGEPGLDNTMQGPKGDAGNPGILGATGEDGFPGKIGIHGNPGLQGRRGQPGLEGTNGELGIQGPPGIPGSLGPQGERGVRGQPGSRGSVGLPGPQGAPGLSGLKGSTGPRGGIGQKGQPGEPGIKGEPGSRGPRGLPGQDGRDGYGHPGTMGVKGELGFSGYPGVPGESGLQGSKGAPGPKGNRGRGGNSGRLGNTGTPGDSGLPGQKGPKGPPGIRGMSECQLITYIRENCACFQGRAECPSYPTELVFVLDMSEDMTPAAFERMRSALLSLLKEISITESNCPTGARVAVMGYSKHIMYLIRFQDYHHKSQLIKAVQNIALEQTTNERYLGAAMRYVGQNVFKRVRQAVRMRKVAIFFSNGPAQDPSDIITATIEYQALHIMPVVVALRNSPNIHQAFEADDTGHSIFTLLRRSQDLATDLRKVRNCAICYDPCRPREECASMQVLPGPQNIDMDLVLVVDGSRKVQDDQYSSIQQLLGSVLDQLAVSPQPHQTDRQTRVALIQQSGSLYSQVSQDARAAKLEFGLEAYQDQRLMKRHVVQSMQQQGGSAALGHTLDYALTDVLLKANSPRKRKVILAVVGAETANWDQAKLHYISQQFKCQGIVLFVVTVGDHYNRTQVEELASFPVAQHLIHLGQLRAEEQDYAKRFFRTFLSTLNRGINAYPPQFLRSTCYKLEDQGTKEVFIEGLEEAQVEQLGDGGQEEFQEQKGAEQIQTDLSQLDQIQTFSRSDGETFPVRSNLSGSI